MNSCCAGRVITSVICAFGLFLSIGASAEVLKPIKPQLRIIQGTTEVAPENIERTVNSNAANIWEIISDTKDIAVLDRFISQFPESIQATFAVRRRDELRRAAAQTNEDKNQPLPEVMQQLAGPNLVLEIQKHLSRLGCQPGKVDGKWGRQSISAANRYSKYSNVVVDTEQPNLALLASVRISEEGICPLVCGVKFNRIGNQCVIKTCSGGQRLSSKGTCYKPNVAKTCGSGQKLSSKGRCYTPKSAVSCKHGERLSSRGVCFVPKARTPKTSTPKKVAKPAKTRCSWCAGRNGTEQYVCNSAKIASLRASGDCN